MSTPRPPRPVCMEIPETPTHRTGQEGRPSHRPAAPIQWFNNKSSGWPAWFRHFNAVADVHGWDKDQRALQMVSYLDEKAMNVAQELSDRELYDYDVLVKLLGIVSIRRLGFWQQGHDSMAGRNATKRMQTPMLIPLQSCVGWVIHRAHRSSAKNSSVNNLFGVSQTLN